MGENLISLKSYVAKTLSAVEARPERSNQHEFNGVQGLKALFGLAPFSREAVFSLKGYSEKCTAGVTWYDARESHETRTEHRLYFQSNPVMQLAEEGDNIIIGFDQKSVLHFILVKSGSDEHGGQLDNWLKY
ncbi:hypothetical protein ABIB42_001586 [Massilia sp. UYP32]|uniref:type II restriction endonuclease n=1 Tax=Massilia sp. UYP32 TaxID=1756386 RepID=UPI003D25266C